MPETGYLIAAVVIGFVITLSLRALPFVALRKLRRSRFVASMAKWMPVGILFVLAAATLHSAGVESGWWKALVAVAVTVAVHLGCGRRTLLSVGAGTVVYIVLVNVL